MEKESGTEREWIEAFVYVVIFFMSTMLSRTVFLRSSAVSRRPDSENVQLFSSASRSRNDREQCGSRGSAFTDQHIVRRSRRSLST